MAAATATEPMPSEGSNFEVVIEKRPVSADFEVIPEEKEEDEIKPDHYYENGGIPVFKPVSSAARSFCCNVLVLGGGAGGILGGVANCGEEGAKQGKLYERFEC